MDFVGHFIDYLLDNGEVAGAILVALVALVASAGWRWWSGRSPTPPGPTASSSGGGQTTQVTGVRTKGDVTVSPTQRHG